MKTITTLALMAMLVCGCHKAEQKPEPEKWQFTTMLWYDGQTNARVGIYLKPTPRDVPVHSADEAVNLVGEYGWEYVRSEKTYTGTRYYFKRHAQETGTFGLMCFPVD